MFFTSLSRIFKHGAANFWRNKSISSASISVLTLTLVIITGVGLLLIIAQTLLLGIESKVDISATFKPDVTETEIFKVRDALKNVEEVGSVEYVSQSDALTLFKERHKNDTVVQQSLEELGQNPFGATLNIKAKNVSQPSQFERIARFLQQDVYTSIIDKINYFDNKAIFDRLSAITAAARQTGVVLSLILIVIAMLVAFNTIRLAIYTARDRITIMRLVGSSNWFIRRPFLIESALNALVAAAITSLFFWIGLNVISPKLSTFFAGPGIEINILKAYLDNFWQFLGLQLGVAILLGVVSAFIAMRRYLKI